MKFIKLLLVFAIGTVVTNAQSNTAAQDDAIQSMHGNVEVAVRRLSNFDPLIRQRAAEELAKLSASDQLKIVEGYYLQEKNDRVKLALEWALYRMGQPEKLFSIVRALDSSRSNQAYAYLITLSSPTPLYMFFEKSNSNTIVKLLEVLAQIGDTESLEEIKAYTVSSNSKISNAARFATREISRRISENPSNKASRPRQVKSNEHQ
jgi:hypothetical protein